MTEPAEPTLALDRGSLAARTREVLNRGNARNPDVLLVDAGDRLVVVKDFAPRAAWVRATIGRWITLREMRAYRILAGHPAVPRLLGRIDALAFVLEYRPGRRMSRRLAAELSPGFIDRLAAAVREMHARGVVHLDLRHRSNVLVDEREQPILIDFASAVMLRPRGLLARRLLPWLARWDWDAVEKWRQRVEPESGKATAASASSGGRRGASRPM
jgi:predicted Ser/Thr protein kinase